MEEEEAKPAAAPAGGDARGSLLDAIRAAGGTSGAGLKSIKERKAEERKKKEEERESSALSSGRKIINISTSQPSTGQEEGEGAET